MKFVVQIETQIERIGRYAIGDDQFREDEEFETDSINADIIEKLRNLNPNQQIIVRRWE